jgi:hypothetical protein
MNSLIHELTLELKSNPNVKDSVAVKVVLESINNSTLLGAPSEEILENSLITLSELATATLNENLKEVVANFRKLGEKPTQRLQNMAKEAGISLKIKALKESKIYRDPTFKYTISLIEQKLAALPEFRVIATVLESLGKYSYDKVVMSTLTDITDYVNENRAKLEVINAIFEMRQTGAVLYRESIIELENCLLENIFSADVIKMKLRGKPSMPTVTRLINTLSMVEAKDLGKFNIGVGNGDAKVKSIIAPFYKISESAAIVYVDNKFIKLQEDQDPSQVTAAEVAEYPDFFEVCEAFAALNFQEKETEIVSNGRGLKVSFAINESGNLYLKINGSTVEDLSKVELSEIFLMEQIETRSKLTTLFRGLDMIVNLEFAKKLVNERLNADSIVFTMGETLYVFEKYANNRIIKKMEGLAFHNYVMENFNYDVSELYAIELEEREKNLRKIDEEKKLVEKDLSKLENSITQLEEALKDSSLSSDYQTQLGDLKVSIEKNVNSLRNHYISLDQSKKKSLNEAEDITLVSAMASKYKVGNRIVLNDGRSARIVGTDPINGVYQLMTADNKMLRVKGSDIEKLEKPKDTDYQPSGVSQSDDKKLAIQDTPFDLDQDK